MTNACRLALVRGVHTAIYLIMSSAVLVVLFAGVTGAHGAWLWVAITLVAIESTVFIANGFRCPLTALAAKYSFSRKPLADTYLPERFTRLTLRIFGPLIVIGLILLLVRWMRSAELLLPP